MNRYFTADTGATYTVIARDLEHAKAILAPHLQPEELERGAPEWVEMSHEWAAGKYVHDDGVRTPLTSFAIGDWFCSEY